MDLDDIPDLSVDEVARRIGTPDFHVYDNNSRSRWRRSHVPTAVWIDPYEISEATMPADKQATLVFYCAGPG